jgi:hypothetical protein
MQTKLPPDRHFGALFSVAFAALAAVSYFRGGHAYPWLLGASGLFAIVTLAKPHLLRPLNALWMRLAALLNRVVSPLVLGAIFYVVLTPVGVIQRLAGRDTMRRKRDSQAQSYWIPREPPGPPPESLRNQF